MGMSRNTVIGLILAALVIATAIAAALQGFEGWPATDGNGERGIYRNPVYAYSLEYPSGLALAQYVPEHVSIGRPTEDGFQTFVNVEVALSGGEGGYESFEEYLFERGRVICAADSPRETISCDMVEERSEYRTEAGADGVELYLRLVRQNLASGTTTTERFGPVFAFDLSRRTPGSEYSALFIYVPLASLGIEDAPIEARDIAGTVSLGRGE